MIKNKVIVGLVLVCFLLMGNLSVQAANDQVLVIHSYHQGYSWVDNINKGIKSSLSDVGVELEFFYMDTKRNTSQEWMKKQGQEAVNKIKQLKPEVVILADDNAQKFVGKKLVNTQYNLVFCGVNGWAKDYNYPGNNVTGILERPHIVQSLQLLNNNVSGIEQVALLTDDSPTATAAVNYAKERLSEVDLEVKIIRESYIDEWKATVKKLNQKFDAVMFYTYSTIKKEKRGESLPNQKVGNWTMQQLQLPSVGLLDWNFTHGAMLGIVESGEEHGYEAGQRAKKIIKGTKPTEIPISTAKEGKIIVNVQTIERLGVDVNYDIIDLADEIIE